MEANIIVVQHVVLSDSVFTQSQSAEYSRPRRDGNPMQQLQKYVEKTMPLMCYEMVL